MNILVRHLGKIKQTHTNVIAFAVNWKRNEGKGVFYEQLFISYYTQEGGEINEFEVDLYPGWSFEVLP